MDDGRIITWNDGQVGVEHAAFGGVDLGAYDHVVVLESRDAGQPTTAADPRHAARLERALASLPPGWDGRRAYADPAASNARIGHEFGAALLGRRPLLSESQLAQEVTLMRAANAYLLFAEARSSTARPKVPIVSGAIALPAREPGLVGQALELGTNELLGLPFAVRWAWVHESRRLTYIGISDAPMVRANVLERLRQAMSEPKIRSVTDWTPAGHVAEGIVQGWAPGFIAGGDIGDFPSIVRRFLYRVEDDSLDALAGLDPDTPQRDVPTPAGIRRGPRAMTQLSRSLVDVDEALARVHHNASAKPELLTHVLPTLERARGIVMPLALEARQSLASLAGTASLHQAAVAERQRGQAEAAQRTTADFERLIALVGAVVLVPGLVISFFGANVGTPARDSGPGALALVLLAAGVAALTLSLIGVVAAKAVRVSRRVVLYATLLGISLVCAGGVVFATSPDKVDPGQGKDAVDKQR